MCAEGQRTDLVRSAKGQMGFQVEQLEFPVAAGLVLELAAAGRRAG